MSAPVSAWCLGLLLTAFAAPGASSNPHVEVTREVHLMGTSCTLTTYSASRSAGLARLESFVQVLEQTEAELSVWRPDSELSRLNRSAPGSPLAASPQLCRLWTSLSLWSLATGGAFDPAVGRLLQCWGLYAEGRWPSAAAVEEARKKSGMDRLGFDPAGCRITRLADAAVDSGAFGKGEALDRVSRSRAGGGTEPWIINLGGQIKVHGLAPGGNPWNVGLAHPEHREQPFLTLWLAEGSVSTSGGSQRDRNVGDRRVAHILDPRSGHPAAFEGSVTVWHRSALAADILSTALLVMGPREGLPWAERRGLSACYLHAGPDRGAPLVRATPAFRRQFLAGPPAAGRGTTG